MTGRIFGMIFKQEAPDDITLPPMPDGFEEIGEVPEELRQIMLRVEKMSAEREEYQNSPECSGICTDSDHCKRCAPLMTATRIGKEYFFAELRAALNIPPTEKRIQLAEKWKVGTLTEKAKKAKDARGTIEKLGTLTIPDKLMSS